jgi:hypothetical protein
MDAQTLKEDIVHYQNLIKTHKKVLQVLELQAAKFSIFIPPHIQIEIDTVKENIRNCNINIDTRKKVLEIQEIIDNTKFIIQNFDVKINFLKDLINDITGNISNTHTINIDKKISNLLNNRNDIINSMQEFQKEIDLLIESLNKDEE